MHITDPVADMLTRIRNANSAKHDTVDVPAYFRVAALTNRFGSEVSWPMEQSARACIPNWS